jgi:hypothetical protein
MRRRLCLFPSDPCRPQNCPVNDPLSDARSQKRSPTTWILNGVCGSGKWGRAGVLNKRKRCLRFYEDTGEASGNETAPRLLSDCRVQLAGTSVGSVLRSGQTLAAFFLKLGAHFHPVFHPSSPHGFGPLR